MGFHQSDVRTVNVTVADRVNKSVHAGLQEIFCVFERRGPAQVRERFHTVLMCLVDNRAIDLGLELRYGSFTIVNPELHEMDTARVQLPNMLAPLFRGCCSIRNT